MCEGERFKAFHSLDKTMAHEGIYATSSECIAKLGEFYNDTTVNEAMINEFCLQAESFINASCRHQFATTIAGFGDITSPAKYLLTEAASNLVGIYVITVDQYTNYNSRLIAENQINILWARFQACMTLLTDQKTVTWIKGNKVS